MNSTPIHAVAIVAAVPVALLAHAEGIEPAWAAAVGATLPAIVASIDLVANGPDLSIGRLGVLTAAYAGGVTALACGLTWLLNVV